MSPCFPEPTGSTRGTLDRSVLPEKIGANDRRRGRTAGSPEPYRAGTTGIVLEAPAGFEHSARDALRSARASITDKLGAIAARAGLQGVLSPGALGADARCPADPYAFLDRDSWPDVFIVLAAAGTRARPSISTLNIDTPLGGVAVDRCAARQIAALARPRPELDDRRPSQHAWQHELLLLQVVARELDRPLRVVPIVAGPVTHRAARRLGRVLSEVLFAQRKRGCLIVTGATPWFERPTLEAIAARGRDELAVDGPEPSLRSHAAALIEFAQADGVVIEHEAGAPGAASIAFTRSCPVERHGAAAAQALRACDRTLFLAARGRRPSQLLHLCDHRAHALGGGSPDVILELLHGVESISHLAHRLSARWGSEVTVAEVAELVEAFAAAGLLHRHEPPSATPSRFLHARATAVLARARTEVPFYQSLASSRLDAAPLMFAADIRAHWHDLFRAGFTWRGPTAAARKRFYLRSSSASSGNQVKTVVEADVMRERQLDWALVAERPDGPIVAINRPANLAMPEDAPRWPCRRRSGMTLRLSPGPNPTTVEPAVWDRTLDAVVAADPVRITGDPAYIAGLARCALRRGVHLPRLEAVEMAQSFAWELYQDVARRAFGVAIDLDYNASEIGSVAVTCREGRLHLLEAHMLYELLDRGVPVGEGALGELVVTTLDTALRPLIRYVLGDVVRLRASSCPCGRPHRVIEYEGRARNLIAGPDGEPVTFRTIDRVIGALPGVDFFRITARRDSAVLALVPGIARDLVDASALADALGACLGRAVRVTWRTSLKVAPTGKLLSVETDDASDAWHRRFLGTTRRDQARRR